MLSRKQKTFMLISGLIGLICSVVVAVPFRVFPGLNSVKGIADIDIIVKLIFGCLAVLLSIYPLYKKYDLMDKLRESSKVILVMVYFPILSVAIGCIINTVYTLSFDYLALGMAAPLSAKVLSVIVAILTAYLVAAIYWIFSLNRVLIKVDKLANQLFDLFIFISIFCIILLQWRVNSLYNQVFANYSEYFLGTPFLFVIYILIAVAFGFAVKILISLIKKDESLIYYIEGEGLNNKIKRVELNNAYNDTLDDFEQFFDEKFDEYDALEIEEVYEDAVGEPKKPENIEFVKIDAEVSEKLEIEEENLVSEDSEELKAINAQKEQILKEIENRNSQLAEIRSQKTNLETAEEELRNLKSTYEAELAEYNQYRVDNAGTTEEPEQPKKKEKKFSPTFEKMVEYANSFNEKEGFKVNANAKGNLLKFYLGKKMFLVMQSTASDYRISFITSPEKFVKYVTTYPGTMVVPKNLSDNNWIKFTNKGKADSKLVKEIIKQAVQTAEKQIAEEKAAKEAAKKEKALARAQERAAAKAAKEAQE